MVQLRDADYSKHFLACAGQARRCAALMSSEQVRRILLQIAQSYEEFARTTEARVTTNPCLRPCGNP